MDLQSFDSAVKKGELPRRFLVFGGPEPFLKERALGRMVASLIAPEDSSENLQRISLASSSSEEVLSRIFSFSFNPSPRIFFLTEPDEMGAGPRKTLLEKIAGSQPPDVFVIFSTEQSRIASEIAGTLGDSGDRIDFWPPFENQLSQWIQKEARESACSIPIEAAEALLAKTGPDLRLIVQELRKLCGNAGRNGTVTVAQVEADVGYLRKETINDLISAVGARNLPASLRISEALLREGTSLATLWYVTYSLARDFRLLHDLAADRPDLLQPVFAKLKEMARLQGKTDFRANQERKSLIESVQGIVSEWPLPIIEAIRLNEPAQIRRLSMALGFSHSELRRLWPRLVEMDAGAKSSPPNPSLFFQEFLVEFLSGKPRPILEG